MNIIRALHRAPDRNSRFRTVLCNHPLRLNVKLLLCSGVVLAFNDDVGFGPRAVHVPFLHEQSLEDVVTAPDDLFFGQGIVDVEDCRKRIDVERHESPGFFQQLLVAMREE